MKNIPNEFIDCVITDPPYFIDGMDNNWDIEKLNNKVKKANVIGSLPVGMKFDPKQGIELQRFMEEVSREIYRILKPGAFYLSFSQGRLYHRMGIAIENSGFEIRDMLIWKREGQAKAFSQDHFVKRMNISDEQKAEIIKKLGGRKTPQLKGQSEAIVLAQKPKDGTFINNWLKYEVGLIDVSQSLDGKFPGTIMEVEKPKGKERENKHICLKPIKLLEHLVRLFTKEGQIVLDPFMGSGSTGISCLNTNRKFIGMEINKEYFDNLDVKFSITSQLFAPVWANSIVGQYEISSPNGVVANGNIIATNTVYKKKAFFYFFNFLSIILKF